MRTYGSRRATEHDNIYCLFGPRSYALTTAYIVYHTKQDPYTVVGAVRIDANKEGLPRVCVWSATQAPSAIRSLLTAASRTALSHGHRAIALYIRAGEHDTPLGTCTARGNRMYDSANTPLNVPSDAPSGTPPLDTVRVASV